MKIPMDLIICITAFLFSMADKDARAKELLDRLKECNNSKESEINNRSDHEV